MASAQLAIAKASLSAALLKADADAGLPSCSRDDIEQFHGLLGAAVARCSPANVQKCKQWTLLHLVPSPARVAALGKYLVALAASSVPQRPGDPNKGPSAKRRRLHILYLLNDVFFHVKFRTQNQSFFDEFESLCSPHLSTLFKSAASFPNAPRHENKLRDLIDIWEKKGYVSEAASEKLRAAVSEGPKSNDSEANSSEVTQKGPKASSARDAPYILPSMHGDASTPWYDLPAANWLPVIEPNSTRPMNPAMIKPLQLAGGPADKDLVDAVKKLLGDVDKIYAKDERFDSHPSVDISQMGELIERDELGDVVGGETYYGWSRAFCEKMRSRRKGDAMDMDDERRERRGSSRSSSRSRSRSRGRSSSRGSPRPSAKRRRISSSRSRSKSRSRSRRRDRSWSSRSRSRSRRRSGLSRSDSHSRSRPPSRSPPQRALNGRDHGSRSRSSYSPPQPLPAHPASSNMPGNGPNNFIPPNLQKQFIQPPPSFPPKFPLMGVPPQPQHLPPQGGFDAWNVPPPPPPPPHYQGQWPPPPPPGMPPVGSNMPQPHPHPGWFPPGGSPPVSTPPGQWGGGGWAPPPPPPGPPQQQGGGFQYGRGGGNVGLRGRGGGYGRGRGW